MQWMCTSIGFVVEYINTPNPPPSMTTHWTRLIVVCDPHELHDHTIHHTSFSLAFMITLISSNDIIELEMAISNNYNNHKNFHYFDHHQAIDKSYDYLQICCQTYIFLFTFQC
jgi:hypothetical protein